MAGKLQTGLLGFRVNGDFGGMTCYTNKNGKQVWFPFSPPTKPPTALQIAQRQRFAAAVNSYLSQSSSVKAQYELATQRASLCLTGQNLWVSVAMLHTFATLDTIAAQTKTTLPHPAAV